MLSVCVCVGRPIDRLNPSATTNERSENLIQFDSRVGGSEEPLIWYQRHRKTTGTKRTRVDSVGRATLLGVPCSYSTLVGPVFVLVKCVIWFGIFRTIRPMTSKVRPVPSRRFHHREREEEEVS